MYYWTDIESMLQEKVKFESEIKALSAQKKQDEETYAEYMKKISTYRDMVEKAEMDAPLQEKIRHLQKSIDDIKEQS